MIERLTARGGSIYEYFRTSECAGRVRSMVAGVAHGTPQTRPAVLVSLLRIRRVDVL
jgi:hypothetical protein